MDEDRDSNFKITDRRKFYPDGSPRESSAQPEQAAAAAAAQPDPAEEVMPEAEITSDAEPDDAGSDNVVSFPGEAGRKREQPSREPAEASAPAADQEKDPQSNAAEQAYSQASGGQASRLPDATFLGLLNMLAVEAAMHLGLIENPVGGGSVVDLDAARHLIDMLGIVEQKTRGNLTPEEDKLFENILADLRVQYVALSRKR